MSQNTNAQSRIAMKFRIIVWSAFAAAFLLVIPGCSSESEGPTASSEPFDIAMVTFSGYAPLYLAQEKGFFGDTEVRLHRIDDIGSMRSGVVSGRLEAFLATPDIALDSDSRPIGRAVWAIDESAGGDGVVVAADISDLSDLKGRVVAAEPGLPPYFVMLYLLHQNGMSLDDVEFRDMTTQSAATAFSSGSVDAAALYEPFLSTAQDAIEGATIPVSSAQSPGMIVDLIFAAEAIESDDPRLIDVVNGWIQAVAYIDDNKAEAYEIMADAFGQSVEEFADIVSGILWLDEDDNLRLFGEVDNPGPLYTSAEEVLQVLTRNRSTVYPADIPALFDRSLMPVEE